jgi:hypothetical protein
MLDLKLESDVLGLFLALNLSLMMKINPTIQT